MSIKKYLETVPNLHNHNIVVTGTTSGLGFALSELLLQKGAHVIMANRQSERVTHALKTLRSKYENAKISSLYFDQCDKVAIARFVEQLKALNLKIDAIIFNAGVYMPHEGLQTSTGLCLTFGVNYFGNYYLTTELFKKGVVNKATRLIYTTSIAAAKSINEKRLHNLFNNAKMPRHRQYKYSKTALNIYVQHLMAQNTHKIYLYHPGVSSTNIVRFKSRSFTFVAKLFMKLMFPNATKAALGALYALTTQEDMTNKIIAPRGLFSISGLPKPQQLKIKSSSAKAELLALSEQLVN